MGWEGEATTIVLMIRCLYGRTKCTQLLLSGICEVLGDSKQVEEMWREEGREGGPQELSWVVNSDSEKRGRAEIVRCSRFQGNDGKISNMDVMETTFGTDECEHWRRKSITAEGLKCGKQRG